MAKHESEREEHYRQWMKMSVARLGWPAVSEQDGSTRAQGGAWAVFGGADDN